MKKIHLTPAGYKKYKDEWHQLKFVERPEMQEQVRVAAAEGDRSENAAYTYGKMRLRHIDQRLRKLDKIIDQAVIVEEVIQDGSIRFGASITLKNTKTSKTQNFHLVGSEEVDPVNGFISMQSPIGKQIKGKYQGDTVVIQSPRGAITYTIEKVQYL